MLYNQEYSYSDLSDILDVHRSIGNSRARGNIHDGLSDKVRAYFAGKAPANTYERMWSLSSWAPKWVAHIQDSKGAWTIADLQNTMGLS